MPQATTAHHPPDDPADGTPGPWLEIVGVAPDLGVIAGDLSQTAGYYRPAALRVDPTQALRAEA